SGPGRRSARRAGDFSKAEAQVVHGRWNAVVLAIIVSVAAGARAEGLPEARLVLGSEGMAKVARAFHEGRHAEARRLLDAHEDDSADAAYLRALIHLEGG